jgi:hypothetical protein
MLYDRFPITRKTGCSRSKLMRLGLRAVFKTEAVVAHGADKRARYVDGYRLITEDTPLFRRCNRFYSHKRLMPKLEAILETAILPTAFIEAVSRTIRDHNSLYLRSLHMFQTLTFAGTAAILCAR